MEGKLFRCKMAANEDDEVLVIEGRKLNENDEEYWEQILLLNIDEAKDLLNVIALALASGG